MKLIADNPSLDNLEKSYLTTAYAAGVTSIEVRNNDRFVNGDLIQIGRPGSEKTEIVAITASVTKGTAMTVGATTFPHEADDPVYKLRYNKVRFYRSTTGIGGSYSVLNEAEVDVDNAILKTVYDDTTSLTTYYYKISYYNSAGSVESSLSDPIPASGYARGTVGFLVNEFFEEVADQTQQNMSVLEAIGFMNEANDDLTTQSRRPYRWLKTSAVLNITLNVNYIALPTDMNKFDRIRYTFDNGSSDTTQTIRMVDMNEFEYINYDNNYTPSDDTIIATIDETTNRLLLWPTPKTSQTGAITVYYWKNFTELTSMADVLETPNHRVYKLFLHGKFYRKKGIKEQSFLQISDRYFNDYTTEVVKLQRSNRLDLGTPQGMRPDTRHSRGLRK